MGFFEQEMVGFVWVDRIDGKGLIREHLRARDGSRKTVCGLEIWGWQPPAGNGRCRRCERLAASEEKPLLVAVERGVGIVSQSSTKWFEDHEEVVRLGRWLAEEGVLDTVHKLLAYFERPWRWSEEREQMLAEQGEKVHEEEKSESAS